MLSVFGLQGLGIAALAVSAPIQLEWSGPAGCPEAAVILEKVNDLVSAEVFTPHAIRARGTITEVSPRNFALHLETEDRGVVGERSLAGRDCEGLADAAALILALMFGATPPPATSPALVEPPAAPLQEPAPGFFDRWRPHAALMFTTTAGVLPGAGAGPTLGLGLRRGPLDVRLHLTYGAEQTALLADGKGAGAKLSLVAGALGLGLTGLDLGAVELGVFCDLELGFLLGRGTGISDPESGKARWSSVGLGGSGRLPLTRSLMLVAEVAAGAPLRRDRFVIDGLGAVFRASPVNGRIAIGVEWRP